MAAASKAAIVGERFRETLVMRWVVNAEVIGVKRASPEFGRDLPGRAGNEEHRKKHEECDKPTPGFQGFHFDLPDLSSNPNRRIYAS